MEILYDMHIPIIRFPVFKAAPAKSGGGPANSAFSVFHAVLNKSYILLFMALNDFNLMYRNERF